ncbi:MAG: bifunctional UDP-N-acetylglucosamine diphosphorylase/glucosamine-1-phosphate N-acetyltransferase GlmU [Gammaproteobacteria bacterium]|nr:bifunctional UDP-N-acetylglucosamine diphosphorylase/glucosamine-1-phosphate N-acetyltransferase GlmU [Gammaproteobacteria bacterium]
MHKPLHIIILAAGAGTRMKSQVPKVLQTVGGRPMIIHVLGTAMQLQPAGVHVVFNPDVPEVPAACAAYDITWAPQKPQLGTGHAVQQAMPGIPDDADVLVLYGDIPLLEGDVLQTLIEAPTTGLKVLTMDVANPRGYGRIVRDGSDGVTGIVEERDATAAQKAITEVNSGVILGPRKVLVSCLDNLASDNSQSEYYLTDIFSIAYMKGIETIGVVAPVADDLEGANDRIQLAELERRYRMKKAAELMREGVQLADPQRVDVRGSVMAGSDVYIDINVILEGDVSLGDGVHIGPGCVLTNCQLAAGTRVHAYSVLEGMRTTGACEIGPFARVRPGTELMQGSKVGNFVEAKNTSLGRNSKASHLSYLGDSSIGDGVNIGAGTITCNYDGANKHRTVIEDDVFIGSDTQLVAPVTIGVGADIGAGSTITKDAPAGKLTISRAKQVTIRSWKRPEKK